MEDIVIRHREGNGAVTERTEPGGGVFVPLKEKKVTTPAWLYGRGTALTPIFTCPVSAIPQAVFDLFEIWKRCRLVHALPHAGGLLDQPWMVQLGFPLFEDEALVVTASAATPT